VTLSAGAPLLPLSAEGDGWSCAPAGDDLTCTLTRDVAAGETAPPIAVRGRAPGAGGSGTLTALVRSDEDYVQSNDRAADTVTVPAATPAGAGAENPSRPDDPQPVGAITSPLAARAPVARLGALRLQLVLGRPGHVVRTGPRRTVRLAVRGGRLRGATVRWLLDGRRAAAIAGRRSPSRSGPLRCGRGVTRSSPSCASRDAARSA
jgi:hypothetical protein